MQYRVAKIAETPDFDAAIRAQGTRFADEEQVTTNRFETFDRAMKFADYLNDKEP